MDRNIRSRLKQDTSRISRRARSMQAVEFFNALTSPGLLHISEAQLPELGYFAVAKLRSLAILPLPWLHLPRDQ